jgi:hypothetical protein
VAKNEPTPDTGALEYEQPAETPIASSSEALLDELLLAAEAAHTAGTTVRAASISGVAIGLLAGLDEHGALVDFPDNPSEDPIPARATVALAQSDVGREVAMLFEGGAPSRPILIGLLHQPSATAPAPAEKEADISASADGERLVFTADKEIVLQCGKASITLTRAGKVLIRGAYVLARSTGVNRIQGGSVLIN